VITLSDVDRAVLEQRARAHMARHAEVMRAKIALMVADGRCNKPDRQPLDVDFEVVSR